jgi:hypothetical protein
MLRHLGLDPITCHLAYDVFLAWPSPYRASRMGGSSKNEFLIDWIPDQAGNDAGQ